MSDEPGFGPETHGTYEPTAEEVAARARRQEDDALDRTKEDLNYSVPGYRLRELRAAEAEVRQLREERDAARSANRELAAERDAALRNRELIRTRAHIERAEAAEAEVRRLTAELKLAREGLRERIERLQALVRDRPTETENRDTYADGVTAGAIAALQLVNDAEVRALLSANPPQGDAAAGSSPSDGGGAK